VHVNIPSNAAQKPETQQGDIRMEEAGRAGMLQRIRLVRQQCVQVALVFFYRPTEPT
jgi:hypothetical protein